MDNDKIFLIKYQNFIENILNFEYYQGYKKSSKLRKEEQLDKSLELFFEKEEFEEKVPLLESIKDLAEYTLQPAALFNKTLNSYYGVYTQHDKGVFSREVIKAYREKVKILENNFKIFVKNSLDQRSPFGPTINPSFRKIDSVEIDYKLIWEFNYKNSERKAVVYSETGEVKEFLSNLVKFLNKRDSFLKKDYSKIPTYF